MMPSAKIAMRLTAPPASVLNTSSSPPPCCVDELRHSGRVDARHRDVGAQPRNDQRTQREQDALAQLLRLAEIAEIEIGGQLFGC